MAIKKLQNDFTTPEQSEMLLEIGVPAGSANCYYTQEEIEGSMYWFNLHIKREYQPHTSLHASTTWGKILPCWSVGRLMEIIDICALGENSNPNTEEYLSTIKVMNKLHIPYVEYLVKSIERAVQLGTIDFSKLED